MFSCAAAQFSNPKLRKGLLITILLMISACNTSAPREEDVVAVRKVLEQRADAVREKNIEKFRDVFMADYSDGKFKLDDIVSEMQQAFNDFESLELTQQRSPVEIKMNTARVVQRIVYDGRGMAKSINGQEVLYIRRIDGAWKISGGAEVGLLNAAERVNAPHVPQ